MSISVKRRLETRLPPRGAERLGKALPASWPRLTREGTLTTIQWHLVPRRGELLRRRTLLLRDTSQVALPAFKAHPTAQHPRMDIMRKREAIRYDPFEARPYLPTAL